jgi:uncharacterized protein YutE (UPF0331/DUF86 family)
MKRITSTEIREVTAELDAELNRLERLEKEIERVSMEASKQKAFLDVFYESLALKLHNFYTGCKRIFQIIASELNGALPSGYDWHKRLLERMAIQREERPAVISQETAKNLEEYLAFRHVVRNIYGYELESRRIDPLVARSKKVFEQFHAEVCQFTKWLRTLASQME